MASQHLRQLWIPYMSFTKRSTVQHSLENEILEVTVGSGLTWET